ncbi:NPCBM/NEW2 domain-containing protein [Enterococcus faecium]|nr:NPCBM/NEW2 domain-containing protein [Enterococcus faecium]
MVNKKYLLKKAKRSSCLTSMIVLTLLGISTSTTVLADTGNGELKSVVTRPEDTVTMNDMANVGSDIDRTTTIDENPDSKNNNQENYRWLSDINFSEYKAGWGGENGVRKNVNMNGDKLTLKVDGIPTTFNKGIFVHADGYVQFDLSKIPSQYNRLVTTVGIDQSQGDNGEVVFYVQVSNDNKTWENLKISQVIKGSSNAEDIDVSVKGYKQLRLWANSHGPNGNDHAVFGGARLVKEDYDLDSELYHGIKPLGEYDKEIANLGIDNAVQSRRDLINKRELVNRLSYRGIQNAVRENEKVKFAIDWLVNDKDALEMFIEVGKIEQPIRFMNALSDIYYDHKEDLNDSQNGNLYKKMMIAAAAGWSSDLYTSPLSFSMPLPSYNISERYQMMKELYENNQMARPKEFLNYDMEHLRMVMNDSISNEELKWLNGFSQTKGNNRLNMWGYGISYIKPNYTQDRLYSLDNKSFFDEKYQLSKYNIPYGLDKDGKKIPRTWMVMEAGGICWNTSRFGQNLLKSNGVATVGIFQPGHEAVLQFEEQKDEKGKWVINNNVGGWKSARTVWINGKGYRMLLDWGNKSFISQNTNNSNNASYTLLAQAAIDSGKFEKSNAYNLAAQSLGNSESKIDAYQKALEILPINLDSFENLIKEYEGNPNTTSSEWNQLGRKVINAYTYYPYAMVDLLKVIKPHLQGDDIANIDILETQALIKATKATEEDVYQYKDTKELANSLLNSHRIDFASFSFSGDQANKIIINNKYDSLSLDIMYSLDGGKEWINAGNVNEVLLTKEQINQVNDINDIKLKINGHDDVVFTIDISKAKTPTDLFANDFENRLLGNIDNLEISLDHGNSWEEYKNQRFTGNQEVEARYKANGTYLQGDPSTFSFKEDDYDYIRENIKYIPYDQMKLSDYSSQQSTGKDHAAQHMLDGLISTAWHTKFGIGSDKELYYTVEFNDVKELSVVDYLPAAQNGRLKAVDIYTSMDGDNWTLSQTFTGIANNSYQKHFVLDQPVKTKFVKIKAKETYGNSEAEQNQYFSGKLFLFFEKAANESPKGEQTVLEMKNIIQEVLKDQNINEIPDFIVTNRKLQPVQDGKAKELESKLKDLLNSVNGEYFINVSANKQANSLDSFLNDHVYIYYKDNISNLEYTFVGG